MNPRRPHLLFSKESFFILFSLWNCLIKADKYFFTIRVDHPSCLTSLIRDCFLGTCCSYGNVSAIKTESNFYRFALLFSRFFLSANDSFLSGNATWRQFRVRVSLLGYHPLQHRKVVIVFGIYFHRKQMEISVTHIRTMGS